MNIQNSESIQLSTWLTPLKSLYKVQLVKNKESEKVPFKYQNWDIIK